MSIHPSSLLLIQYWVAVQPMTVCHRAQEKSNHSTHIHIYGQFRITQHAYLREEPTVARENPHRHGESTVIPHRKVAGSQRTQIL